MNRFLNNLNKLGCSLRIVILLLFVNMYVNAQTNGYSDAEEALKCILSRARH